MDGGLAIEHNREALKRILLALVAMAGFGGRFTFGRRECGGPPDVARAEKEKLSPAPALPRHLHRAVLRLLRPAELATRRLIIALARGIVVRLPAGRPRKLAPAPLILRNGIGTGIVAPRGFQLSGALAPVALRSRPPCLPLLDPLRRAAGRRWVRQRGIPRICVPGWTDRAYVAVRRPAPDDPMDGMRLAGRFEALASALDDLPRQALRFARWRARRNLARQGGRIRRLWPLRMGRPPGWRRAPVHEVHEVLDHANRLAVWALEQPDTS